jgi:hypothetical protein
VIGVSKKKLIGRSVHFDADLFRKWHSAQRILNSGCEERKSGLKIQSWKRNMKRFIPPVLLFTVTRFLFLYTYSAVIYSAVIYQIFSFILF